jgi:thiol:disulfide interchange protein DsbD
MIEFDKITGAEAVGEFQSVDKKATVKHDEIFGMEIGTFTGSVTFAQRMKITNKAGFSIEGNVRAQACNDQTCTPPLPVDFSFAASDLPASVTVAGSTSTGESTLPSTPAETGVPADTTEEQLPRIPRSL